MLPACGGVDGEVLGFAGAQMLDAAQCGFDSYLATLYLKPELKRQGLGRALRFYEKLGARLIPQGVGVEAGHFDDVVYAFDDLKALAASH